MAPGRLPCPDDSPVNFYEALIEIPSSRWDSNLRRGYTALETFMAVVQRTGPGTNPCIPCVVSKSDSIHGTATTATEPLG